MRKIFVGLIFLVIFFASFSKIFAEDKPQGGNIIPKIPKTADDPVLVNGGVYPMWGPPCQRYTYHTTYRDKEGRVPEYVKMYFNGDWIDVKKVDPNDSDYKKGVTYAYEFVPSKIGPNFFFFEASNGKGKVREGIIDSPGNGPVLFESDFLDNQVVVVEKESGRKILDYQTGNEWIGGLALSDDGKFLAVKTSLKIYLFETAKPAKPFWTYSSGDGSPMVIGGDVKGGVAISSDGSVIFASMGDNALLFNRKSNNPVWKKQIGNAYNVAVSSDGKYVAVATAGSENDQNTNLLILWDVKSSKPLWQYHASGNFHDVALSADGKYVVGATGCPDRKAYLFEKSSDKPLIESDQLTYDSPVSRSKISKDGALAAYNTDGGPNSSMLYLFSKSSDKPMWKFNAPVSRASRALGISANGDFIGVANVAGDIYLFSKENNIPLKEWKISATIGALDIADDGSYLAVGGTDNKLYLLDKTGGKTEFALNEFVQEIDISGNGKLIAAGTGGSNYFFEEIISPGKGKVFNCSKIIEPQVPFEQMLKVRSGEAAGGQSKLTVSPLNFINKIVNFFRRILGLESKEGGPETGAPEGGSGEKIEGKCPNTICEPMAGENKDNCPKDCSGGD